MLTRTINLKVILEQAQEWLLIVTKLFQKTIIVILQNKVMFGNNFYFLFSKTCFWEYKEKTIFLYF